MKRSRVSVLVILLVLAGALGALLWGVGGRLQEMPAARDMVALWGVDAPGDAEPEGMTRASGERQPEADGAGDAGMAIADGKNGQIARKQPAADDGQPAERRKNGGAEESTFTGRADGGQEASSSLQSSFMFDLVRVDASGHVVLAGRARPNARIAVLVDGRVWGTVPVDTEGAWIFSSADKSPLHAEHQIAVRIEDANGRVLARMPQSIVVSMRPVEVGGTPLVVLTAPDAPSRVLQHASSSPLATEGQWWEAAGRSGRASSDIGEVRQRVDDERMVARQHRQEAAAARRAAAEELSSAVRMARQVENGAEGGHQSGGDDATGGGRQVEESTSVVAGSSLATDEGMQPRLVPRAVDYDTDGNIFFTGSGVAGAVLRLYVNNRHLGDVRVDEGGTWQWRGHADMPPGRHLLRVDRLAADGRVLERVELPFVRADMREIAKARAGTGVMSRQSSSMRADAARARASGGSEGGSGGATPVGILDDDGAEKARHAAVNSMSLPAASKEKAQEPGEGISATGGPRSPHDLSGSDRSSMKRTDMTGAPGNGFIIVQPGNNLWNIARVIYGKGVRYTTIYEANRDRIRNPHRIYPGQVFTAPGLPVGERGIDPRRRRPATPEELEQPGILR